MIIVDNGADAEVKAELCDPQIIFPDNIWVNPAWNALMQYFLAGSWSTLIIASSDVILASQWLPVLRAWINSHPKTIFIPQEVTSLDTLQEAAPTTSEVVTGGTPGIFMVLPRKVVELVYPIPSDIKMWFGDEWIFTKAKNAGYEIRMLHGIPAYHYGSLGYVEATYPQIELDKLAWETVKQLL